MDYGHDQSCIESCNAWAVACDQCTSGCLREHDVRMMAQCIRLDVDSAELCRLVAAYMARVSNYAVKVCQLCAELCESWDAECAKHRQSHCQACAEACRRCGTECRRMT